MAKSKKVGRPLGSGGKKKSDAAKIRTVLENKGVEYPTKKVIGILKSRGVEDNKALQVKISQQRAVLREAA